MILSYTHNVGFRLSSQHSVVLTSICLSCRFRVLTFLDDFCEVRNQSDRRMTEIFPDLNQRVAVSYWICSLTVLLFCLLFLVTWKRTVRVKQRWSILISGNKFQVHCFFAGIGIRIRNFKKCWNRNQNQGIPEIDHYCCRRDASRLGRCWLDRGTRLLAGAL